MFSPFDIKNSYNKNLNFSQQGFNLNLTQSNANLQDGKVSAFKLQEKEKDSNSNNNNVFNKCYILKSQFNLNNFFMYFF